GGRRGRSPAWPIAPCRLGSGEAAGSCAHHGARGAAASTAACAAIDATPAPEPLDRPSCLPALLRHAVTIVHKSLTSLRPLGRAGTPEVSMRCRTTRAGAGPLACAKAWPAPLAVLWYRGRARHPSGST